MTSSFTVKMIAGSLPPVTGSNVAKVAATTSVKPPALPLQVRIKEQQKLETPEKTYKNVSRRDLALILTAASFTTITLSSPKPAQAQISKSEIKKILVDKFKLLSEKLGLSKPEPEEIEKITTPPPPIAGKKVQSSPSTPKADKEIHSAPAPPTAEKKDHSSPAPPIAEEKDHSLPSPPISEKKIHVPQEPRLPSIQNGKKVVVEAATLP
ncbi:uncharacterized protein [Rutidosis leptorrhynchoides]|uniref:uncharacterized protein n=1 Tax=Rutidosis leptorrhynchoides TaxID=125765 RepID=UPI003A99230F